MFAILLAGLEWVLKFAFVMRWLVFSFKETKGYCGSKSSCFSLSLPLHMPTSMFTRPRPRTRTGPSLQPAHKKSVPAAQSRGSPTRIMIMPEQTRHCVALPLREINMYKSQHPKVAPSLAVCSTATGQTDSHPRSKQHATGH